MQDASEPVINMPALPMNSVNEQHDRHEDLPEVGTTSVTKIINDSDNEDDENGMDLGRVASESLEGDAVVSIDINTEDSSLSPAKQENEKSPEGIEQKYQEEDLKDDKKSNETIATPVPDAASRASLEKQKSGLTNLEKSTHVVLIKCIEQLMQIKVCMKNEKMKNLMEQLKPLLQTECQFDKFLIVELFQYCFESSQDEVMNISLDTISKLASFAYFSSKDKTPASFGPPKSLLQCMVDMVCDSINDEVVDGNLQLNVVKALSAFILCSEQDSMLHGAILLNSVRKLFNVFLLGDSDTIQSVAQASLTQAVTVVYERLRASHTQSNSTSALPEEDASVTENWVHDEDEPDKKITLHSMASAGTSSLDHVKVDADDPAVTSVENSSIQDAFLVFRSMCRLAVRQTSPDKVSNIRSQAMRAKLISLHLIYRILEKNSDLFMDPTLQFRGIPALKGMTLVHASRQYICLVLSRNAVSPVPQVFEVCCDIFYLMVFSLRAHFKQEIEVFFREVYFPMLDLKNTSYNQKLHTLLIIQRICLNPRALVELYINYDCDRSSTTNVFEQLLFSISKVTTNGPSETISEDIEEILPSLESSERSSTPFLNTNSASLKSEVVQLTTFSDFQLKLKTLQCVLDILQSLSNWAESGLYLSRRGVSTDEQGFVGDYDALSRSDTPVTNPYYNGKQSFEANSHSSSSIALADPSQFESNKQRKKLLRTCINKFNYKPTRGLKMLSENEYVDINDPKAIAEFLFRADGIDKTTLGDYLGEGDEKSISVMHEFIDCLSFINLKFVDALRRLLQCFRLPGEAQKIDRIMLKFSERYMKENPSAFANADTAYILAYSIILLNTDLHSPRIKNKMTKEDFIKNNRGINDGADLDEDYLGFVYDDILKNEIAMKDDQELAAIAPLMNNFSTSSGFTTFTSNGRDLQRVACIQASEEMANKATSVLKKLLYQQKHGSQKTNVYYNATHFEHIGPMLEATWMPILAALSNPLQNSDYVNELNMCLDGFQLVVRIACLFDLDLIRDAFIKTLTNFTNLHSTSEIKLRNTMVIKTLLRIASTEGNNLKDSWKDILTIISQLERVQLIGVGVDETEVPDVINARVRRKNVNIGSSNSIRHVSGSTSRSTRTRSLSKPLSPEAVSELMSTEVVLSIDRIFTQTSSLSGSAIVSFFKALCEVSWDEITSSSDLEQPRLYSLQKLVEISYYNMQRIRVEWSSIWNVLGRFFNMVGSDENRHVAVFALDSLRQLSMHFLEIEELSLFSFQKEFLKPFEYVMASDTVVEVKELVLQCVKQMIQAKISKIKSGWKTLFGVFTFAAKARSEILISMTFDTLVNLFSEHYDTLMQQNCLIDMLISFTELCKNGTNQKISLQSLEIIREVYSSLSTMIKEGLSSKPSVNETFSKYVFPVLFAYYDIIMSAEDLEVRSRALQNLFYIFLEESDDFTEETWEVVSRKFIFPIFSIFGPEADEATVMLRDEEIRTWQSTTLVEALRSLVTLLTRRFDKLHNLLKGYLWLFSNCICRDNITLSRIGTNCMQQLLSGNAYRFEVKDWDLVADMFIELFKETTPHQLLLLETFSNGQGASVYSENENTQLSHKRGGSLPETSRSISTSSISPEKQMEFRSMIRKCILQLLLISIVAELLDNEEVFNHIPHEHVLKITVAIYDSWQFARKFNEDKSLRITLLNVGFMKQLPNLLRQETASALLYITLLFRLLKTRDPLGKTETDRKIHKLLFPVCAEMLDMYASLVVEKHTRNHAAWQPVIATILDSILNLPLELFSENIHTLYFSCCSMIAKENLDDQLRELLKNYFNRVGHILLNQNAQQE
ncbi:Protein transport protein sec72 [Schizosaccharomyces pombe]